MDGVLNRRNINTVPAQKKGAVREAPFRGRTRSKGCASARRAGPTRNVPANSDRHRLLDDRSSFLPTHCGQMATPVRLPLGPAVAAQNLAAIDELAGRPECSEWTTATRVPISTSVDKCSTAAFNMRKQPDDCARPIERASFVPWIR